MPTFSSKTTRKWPLPEAIALSIPEPAILTKKQFCWLYNADLFSHRKANILQSNLIILSIISDNCQKGLLSAPSSTKIPHLRMAGLSLGGWGLGAGIYPSYFYRKTKKELKNIPADYLIAHLLIADILQVTCNLSNCPGILLIMKSLCTSQNVGADWVCKNNATSLLMGPNSNRSITFTLQ